MELKPDGDYELFGGNVRGKVREVEQPTKLVQSWQTRNGKWPTGDFDQMTILGVLTCSRGRSLRYSYDDSGSGI